jgi:hypothetical protein
MNPDLKLLLDEMNRLFAEQKTQIEKRFEESDRKLNDRFTDSHNKLELRFTAVDDTISKRIAEVNDAFAKRFADSDLNWERRITDLEMRQISLISDSEQRQEALIAPVTKAAGELQSWHQESEGTVHDLKLKVDKLAKYWDRSLLDNATASTGVISHVPPSSEQTAARPSVGTTVAWPSGHHVETMPRVDGVGGKLPQLHGPANGTHSDSPPNLSLYHGAAYENQSWNHHPDNHQPDNGHMPKMNFPIYEGEYTRLWVQQAEDYFDMYDVSPHRWVKVSHMNFHGAAVRWIAYLGLISANSSTIALAMTSVIGWFGKCFTSICLPPCKIMWSILLLFLTNLRPMNPTLM